METRQKLYILAPMVALISYRLFPFALGPPVIQQVPDQSEVVDALAGWGF